MPGGWFNNGSVINDNGTATIAAGDNVTDTSGHGVVLIGGSGFIGGSGLSGYVTMSGGTLGNGSSIMQEVLGIASGSGIFTQTGGVNVPYGGWPGYDSGSVPFSNLQLGFSSGGYGEYDMSGGSLGVNAIYLGGSTASQMSSAAGRNCGTGVFTQTGGSIGSFVTPGVSNNAVGLSVGGNWVSYGLANTPTSSTSLGTYTLGAATGVGAVVRRRRRDSRRYWHRHVHPELRNQRHRRLWDGYWQPRRKLPMLR